VAEDEMCIGVVMYWPLDEILNADGSLNQQAIQDFESDRTTSTSTGLPDGCPSRERHRLLLGLRTGSMSRG